MDDHAPLTAAETEQTWQRIRRSATSTNRASTRKWFMAFAVATAGAVLAFVMLRRDEPPREWYEVASAECVEHHAGSLSVKASCGTTTVRIGADQVELAAASTLEHAADGALALRRGKARFRIAKRTDHDQAFTVAVSGGAIRVLGTVFDVEQGTGQGEVVLESGRIQFLWNDDAPPTMLAPGERLAWPRPAPAPPESAEPPRDRPQAHAPHPPKLSVDAVMARQYQLRGQRRYDEAAELLGAASQRDDFTQTQRARFSYELGQLLTSTGQSKQACAHWRQHAARFPDGAHADTVKAAVAACKAN